MTTTYVTRTPIWIEYREDLEPQIERAWLKRSQKFKEAHPLNEIITELRALTEAEIHKLAPYGFDTQAADVPAPMLVCLLGDSDDDQIVNYLADKADRARSAAELTKLGILLGASPRQIQKAIQRKIRLVSEFQQLIKNEA